MIKLNMSGNLISSKSKNAYLQRLQKIQKMKFTRDADELFQVMLTAKSEQIENLHVKTIINGKTIENDTTKELGSTSEAPSPMEMLLASFANCLEISALLYFSFNNVNVDSVKLKVTAEYDKRCVLPDKEAPEPGFYNINYTWYIESKEKRKKIEAVLDKVNRNCPVKGTFSRNHAYKQIINIL